MNITAKEFLPYYKQLYDKVIKLDLVIDKTGVLIAELLSITVPLTIDDNITGELIYNSRQSPKKYIDQENNWYNSHSLNIEQMNNIQVWKNCADENDEINSNYGNLVFSRNNFSQFSNVLNTLKTHKDSRQAIIIYTRPSIHYEWNSHNASDFICTNFQHFLIRNNKLNCIVNMRSQDVIYGLFSDIPWFFDVYKKMFNELKITYPDLEYGNVFMQYNSFHCYERHFEILEKIVNDN